MKIAVIVLTGLLAHRAEPPARPARPPADREPATPAVDAALQRAAGARVAYLADVLRLRHAQAARLQRPTYDALWELRTAEPCSEAIAQEVAGRYHRRLLGVLSPGQYGALLRLEDGAAPAPAPPVADHLTPTLPCSAPALTTIHNRFQPPTGPRPSAATTASWPW